MKVLFIGGTGNISTPVSQLAIEKGIELYHLNRGNRPQTLGVQNIIADINNFENCQKVLENYNWDVVVNWIAFTPNQIENDIKLFTGKTKQYIFISSASAYQKPPVHPIITESTPLKNPFWDYSRDKIACEEVLVNAFRENNFPMTIIRPSHTYYSVIPITLGGWEEYTAVDRIKKGQPIVIQGDGTSLWTMTHASDFAKGFLGIMNNPMAIGEAFHITSDEALSWNQIYEFLADAVGKKADIVHIASKKIIEYADATNYPSQLGNLWGDKSHAALFDNSKIKKYVPDYMATIPFSTGIKQTIAWFEADHTRMKIDPLTNQFFDGLIKNYG